MARAIFFLLKLLLPAAVVAFVPSAPFRGARGVRAVTLCAAPNGARPRRDSADMEARIAARRAAVLDGRRVNAAPSTKETSALPSAGAGAVAGESSAAPAAPEASAAPEVVAEEEEIELGVLGLAIADGGCRVLLRFDAPSTAADGAERERVIALRVDEEGGAPVRSPEALTLLQLCASIDMAGAVLPPDALARRWADAGVGAAADLMIDGCVTVTRREGRFEPDAL